SCFALSAIGCSFLFFHFSVTMPGLRTPPAPPSVTWWRMFVYARSAKFAAFCRDRPNLASWGTAYAAWRAAARCTMVSRPHDFVTVRWSHGARVSQVGATRGRRGNHDGAL